jgi:hypothetical protein
MNRLMDRVLAMEGREMSDDPVEPSDTSPSVSTDDADEAPPGDPDASRSDSDAEDPAGSTFAATLSELGDSLGNTTGVHPVLTLTRTIFGLPPSGTGKSAGAATSTSEEGESSSAARRQPSGRLSFVTTAAPGGSTSPAASTSPPAANAATGSGLNSASNANPATSTAPERAYVTPEVSEALDSINKAVNTAKIDGNGTISQADMANIAKKYSDIAALITTGDKSGNPDAASAAVALNSIATSLQVASRAATPAQANTTVKPGIESALKQPGASNSAKITSAIKELKASIGLSAPGTMPSVDPLVQGALDSPITLPDNTNGTLGSKTTQDVFAAAAAHDADQKAKGEPLDVISKWYENELAQSYLDHGITINGKTMTPAEVAAGVIDPALVKSNRETLTKDPAFQTWMTQTYKTVMENNLATYFPSIPKDATTGLRITTLVNKQADYVASSEFAAYVAFLPKGDQAFAVKTALTPLMTLGASDKAVSAAQTFGDNFSASVVASTTPDKVDMDAGALATKDVIAILKDTKYGIYSASYLAFSDYTNAWKVLQGSYGGASIDSPTMPAIEESAVKLVSSKILTQDQADSVVKFFKELDDKSLLGMAVGGITVAASVLTWTSPDQREKLATADPKTVLKFTGDIVSNLSFAGVYNTVLGKGLAPVIDSGINWMKDSAIISWGSNVKGLPAYHLELKDLFRLSDKPVSTADLLTTGVGAKVAECIKLAAGVADVLAGVIQTGLAIWSLVDAANSAPSKERDMSIASATLNMVGGIGFGAMGVTALVECLAPLCGPVGIIAAGATLIAAIIEASKHPDPKGEERNTFTAGFEAQFTGVRVYKDPIGDGSTQAFLNEWYKTHVQPPEISVRHAFR